MVFSSSSSPFSTESRPSSTVTGIPEKAEIKPPKLPTLNRISNDNIAKVEMVNPNNVNMI